MKTVQLLMALGFASLFAHATAAQTDPYIGFGGTGSISASCTMAEDACALSGGTIVATLGPGTIGGTVDLYNDLGVDVPSLTITDTNLPTYETLSCQEPTEFFATVTPSGDSCTFSGVGVIPDDLPAGDTGGIILGNFVAPNAIATQVVDLTVTAPEPSSMLLLGIGLVSILAIGKGRWIKRSEI